MLGSKIAEDVAKDKFSVRKGNRTRNPGSSPGNLSTKLLVCDWSFCIYTHTCCFNQCMPRYEKLSLAQSGFERKCNSDSASHAYCKIFFVCFHFKYSTLLHAQGCGICSMVFRGNFVGAKDALLHHHWLFLDRNPQLAVCEPCIWITMPLRCRFLQGTWTSAICAEWQLLIGWSFSETVKWSDVAFKSYSETASIIQWNGIRLLR